MALRSAPLRFGVGRFDDWAQLQIAMRDANGRGLSADTFSCLALQRVFKGNTFSAPAQRIVTLQFADNAEPIGCTEGRLADCLTDSLGAGACSLKDALGEWDISRHAAELENAVLAGKILLWIEVADAENERQAYRMLFAHGSNSVGVHDLRRPVR